MSIQEQMLARRQEIARRVARVDAELVQVKADLIAAGVRRPKDDGMRFLFREDYPIGLPIILDHLKRPYSDLPKAVMADALFYTKNPHTRKIWPEVSELYQATPNTALQFNDDPPPEYESDLKLTLANVLIKQYEPKRCEALLDIVRNKTNGETRIILLRPLLRIRNRKPGMMDILSELKKDPVLAIELGAKGVP